jgi:hypothetical protein
MDVDARSEWLSRRFSHVLSVLSPMPLLFPKPFNSSSFARVMASSVRFFARDASISCLTFLICAPNFSDTVSVTMVLILLCTLFESIAALCIRSFAF